MENLPRDKKEEWHKGERSQLITHQDNLRTEGNVEKRHVKTWKQGEKFGIVKRDDNLHQEGDFDKDLFKNGNLVIEFKL